MQWTKEKPTKEGFYWTRVSGSDRSPRVVEIYGTPMLVFFMGTENEQPLSTQDFEWFGPLEPTPEDVVKLAAWICNNRLMSWDGCCEGWKSGINFYEAVHEEGCIVGIALKYLPSVQLETKDRKVLGLGSQWIEAKKEFPPDGSLVIIFTDFHALTCGMYHTGKPNQGWWTVTADGLERTNVIYWKPLGEPPPLHDDSA